jgi:hypothetical protein
LLYGGISCSEVLLFSSFFNETPDGFKGPPNYFSILLVIFCEKIHCSINNHQQQ